MKTKNPLQFRQLQLMCIEHSMLRNNTNMRLIHANTATYMINY